MLKLLANIAIITGFTLSTASCGQSTASKQVVPSQLAQLCAKQWQLTHIEKSGVDEAIEPKSNTTLHCTPDGGITGKAAINRYFGNFVMASNGNIEWPNSSLASTRMAGPLTLMQQEKRYLSALTKTNKMFLIDQHLVFTNDQRSVSLSFKTIQ